MFQGDDRAPAAPRQEDAAEYLVGYLKRRPRLDLPQYGYDVWLVAVITEWIHDATARPLNHSAPGNWARELSAPFYAAAWDLCRLGVLRPGPRHHEAQAVGEGQGYTLTLAGRAWLEQQSAAAFIPTDGTRTAEMLAAAGPQFGPVYRVRAIEAARCYAAGAYYACCAMVGAAAESVILAVGSAKLDEAAAEKLYFGHAGRSKLEDAILRDAPTWLQKQFRGHTALIALWRDRAAHAHEALVTESEAYMDLRGLLRFATEVTEHWETLTRAAE